MSNTTNGVIPTIITVTWKQVWDDWNLRGFIILSLSLQTYLVFFASFRKRTRRNFITMPLWSAYLLADWAANFAVGLISSNQGETIETNQNGVQNNKGGLMAFWAPFLLVHLGGPDTITAFALEDNELWLRHLLGLIFQCLAAVYVFLQSLPTDELWIPTLLMFITGIIKYAERTRSLYLASLDSFRDSMLKEPDPGPNYAKLMDEYTSKKQAHLPTRIEMIAEPDRVIKTANKAVARPLEPLEVVQYAYRYFENFRGLIVNQIFSFRERNQSREFFLKRNAKDAFDVVEVELNFFYEVLYTKLNVVYSKVGYVCRPFSVGAVITSLVLFHSLNKDGFEDGFDVTLTYTLLIGALALDGVGLFMLVFSDFTFVKLDPSPSATEEDNTRTLLTRFLTKLLEFKTHRWFQNTCLWRLMGVFARRWCENVGTYSLLHYCLNRRSKILETLYSYLGILAFIDEIVYAKRKPFPVELKTYIFKELKTKSKMADDLETSREIYSARGDWVLRIESCSTLLPYIVDVDYDESILLWHVATELLYNSDLESMNEEERKRIVADEGKKITEAERKTMSGAELKKLKREEFRKFSKLISDYMVYLLVMKPMMMSTVGGIGQIRFGDTCAEAKKFFNRDNPEKEKGIFRRLRNLLFPNKEEKKKEAKREENKKLTGIAKLIKACKDIHDVNTEVKPITVKGDRSKSVLFDGCLLAKELEKLGTSKSKVEKDKWEVLSKVWIELLCYAASHIQPTAHVQQVSRGGELITVVWLLMAHLGLGAQFQINEGHARAKLIVGK